MYRAVYRTARDRRPCCGPVAVVLSADLHVTSDRWTENRGVYRKRRHTAGPRTLEHHRRCPLTNARPSYDFCPLELLGFGVDQGDKTTGVEPETRLLKTESKCFSEWIGQSGASQDR